MLLTNQQRHLKLQNPMQQQLLILAREVGLMPYQTNYLTLLLATRPMLKTTTHIWQI